MFKKELRLFGSAFFITLLCVGWLATFFIVDASNTRFENGRGTPALALSCVDALHYEVDLLGQAYVADLSPLNRLSYWRKRYACLVTPRIVLALEQGLSAARRGGIVLRSRADA